MSFYTALAYTRAANRDAQFSDLDISEQDHLTSLWMAEQSLLDLLDPVSSEGEAAIVAAIARAMEPPLGVTTASAFEALGVQLMGCVSVWAMVHVAKEFNELLTLPAWAA